MLYSEEDWFIYSCDSSLERIIVGEEFTALFFITFFFSLLSVFFGVSKCLKTCSARMLGDQGYLSIRSDLFQDSN